MSSFFRRLGLFVAFIWGSHVALAADCPMTYKTQHFYGGYASCQGAQTIIYPTYDGGCSNYYARFTLSAYFPEQSKSTAHITEGRQYEGSGICLGNRFVAADVHVLSCTASLPLVRTQQVPDRTVCNPVTSFKVAGNSYPLSASQAENYKESFNIYKIGNTLPIAWGNSGGRTRIEYRLRVGLTFKPWRHLNTFSDSTTQTTVDLRSLLTQHNDVSNYPYSLDPTALGVAIQFRLRAEPISSGTVSAWRYADYFTLFYSEATEIVTYYFPDTWAWSAPMVNKPETHSGVSVQLTWPAVVWGVLYEHAYLSHNGKQIEIPRGRLSHTFVSLPPGVHNFTVMSCDLPISESEAACMQNYTRIVLTIN